MRILLLTSMLVLSLGCGEDAEEALASLTQLQEEYSTYDLTCAIDTLLGTDDVEDDLETASDTSVDTNDSSCEDSSEQFSMLLAQYGGEDGAFSDDEVAQVEEEWETMQVEAMDANDDDEVSDEEKTLWGETNRAARKELRAARFAEACENLGKTEEECKELRKERKEKYREALQARFAEFDTDENGTLDSDERKAMKEALKAERKTRKDARKTSLDKDGDGVISEDERREKNTERRENAPKKPKPSEEGGSEE